MAVIAMIMAGASAHAGSGGGTGGVGSGGGGGGGGDRYDRLWRDFSHKQKRWAYRTSDCESGGRAHIDSGSYHGAFQFLLSTWRQAPRSPGGDAHKYRWRVQAVVAVELKKRDGAKTYWPNCG